jgi:mRNA-degrading endonuclease RelE of RelBE toxin-antitoxin system
MSHSLNSSTTKSFRNRFQNLSPEIRQLARKNFKLSLRDPRHPSLHFKKAGDFWSVRVGGNHRALAVWSGDKIEWFWIGSHDEYEDLIS